MVYIMIYTVTYTMVYIQVYTLWYISRYISRYIPFLHGIYHGIYHDIYHIVYTIWYISLDLWYIPVESGIYHDATFQMAYYPGSEFSSTSPSQASSGPRARSWRWRSGASLSAATVGGRHCQASLQASLRELSSSVPPRDSCQ